ncbi:MAG: hypothetical protein ACTHNZ_09965 [Trinickia sp.]|uniref:hypothetical protein n=1 Tax=Trinickia sp. TaxID=2571163 RepID=UPI003F7CDBFB
MNKMSENLTLTGRAEADPVLQRVLKTYREASHGMARDYWRGCLEIFATGGAAAAAIYATKFEEVVARKAAEIEAETGIAGLGAQFIAYVQEERERLLQEFERDPAALSRSLDASPLTPAPAPIPAPTQPRNQRMSVGEMAVRTAVRATVWTLVRNAIRSIFR